LITCKPLVPSSNRIDYSNSEEQRPHEEWDAAILFNGVQLDTSTSYCLCNNPLSSPVSAEFTKMVYGPKFVRRFRQASIFPQVISLVPFAALIVAVGGEAACLTALYTGRPDVSERWLGDGRSHNDVNHSRGARADRCRRQTS
jgi:hypothetical protein